MTTRIQTFNGNIGIGTNDPGSYKLRVDGSVRADSLEINGVTNAQVPSGLIAMWSGTAASVPTGWALCDGSNSTPNLVGRFIRGASGDAPSPVAVGTSGGANTVALAENNLAQHNHPGNSGNAGANHTHEFTSGNQSANHTHPVGNNNRNHSHNIPDLYYQPGRDWHQGQGTQSQYGNVNWYGPYNNAATSNINANHGHPIGNNSANHGHPIGNNSRSHTHEFTTGNQSRSHTHSGDTGNQSATHSHSITIGNTGNGVAVAITNPYYALAYIMKL